MRGLLLTADLSGCRPGRAPMTDLDALRRLCLDAVAEAGLVAVGERFHRYAPEAAPAASPAAEAPAPVGITGVVLLAESHLAVHTWPELGQATLDVYVCNLGRDNSARAEALIRTLIDAFAPASAARQSLGRGQAPRGAGDGEGLVMTPRGGA